jgi:hypothetical protein
MPWSRAKTSTLAELAAPAGGFQVRLLIRLAWPLAARLETVEEAQRDVPGRRLERRAVLEENARQPDATEVPAVQEEPHERIALDIDPVELHAVPLQELAHQLAPGVAAVPIK